MSGKKDVIPHTVNPDLLRERRAASFRVYEFACWWHGGAEKLRFKRDLEQEIFKDLTDHNTLLHYKSHEEICEMAVKQSIELAKKLRAMQARSNPGGNEIWPKLYSSSMVWGAVPAGHPFAVQYAMMVDAIKKQGTDEQWERFGKRVENFEICGTYAQTELGHGTFLRGLETRADYDRTTDEFVLNSPTLSAYKWWPGGLGHCSNYCLLVAQLYIDDTPKGVQMFIVQLRDEETHLPLPGIDIGEIGHKMGFYGANNGFLGLKNVRIPRTNMLMRNAKVLPNGTFVKSPASVLTYFTMVMMRCVIVQNSSTLLAVAATIATRYSFVRRQSPINPNEPEPQIIDHVTQQLKVFPEIAISIAYQLAAKSLWSLYYETYADIERGDYTRLPELHNLSCALKALCAADSNVGAERLRLACGGHGYLTSANLHRIVAAAAAACTYEGENTVLLLQVGRFLIKSWSAAIAGKPLTPTASYLAGPAQGKAFGPWTGDWANIVATLQYAAANKVRLAYENLAQRLKQGQSEGEAANNTGIELTQAAELHGRSFVAATFLAHVTGSEAAERSAALNRVLQRLLELYLVHTTLRHLSDILQCISFSDVELRSLQTRLETALKQLRPDAVPIVDGFDFPDRLLSSTLGSYDGNVYERMFDLAKQSPLNQQSVPKSFHTVLKPFLKSNL
ncbi:PREDICTED: probable peroxisomal acyl-coenzyme A oxidase 1 [Rhagoletis zephyria]|uniref:probable peroxisomal acyl-coenzyme A oxidase 1 n=1 Tax=Rhagoletis zephyria TaxID=28612 RepID=UPI0008112C77|nr:PREDICTED: probable peroxisomal acyl-coenzyme A oxidase 1 [Rhagoletis zephyria]